jgi:putative DNA-invertase from lambdoid prophage Rac
VFAILSAVAEAEQDRNRERVTQVKWVQRQQNRYLGGIVPFGFRDRVRVRVRVRDDGRLVPDEPEQDVIAQARSLRVTLPAFERSRRRCRGQPGRKQSLDALQRMLSDSCTIAKSWTGHMYALAGWWHDGPGA